MFNDVFFYRCSYCVRMNPTAQKSARQLLRSLCPKRLQSHRYFCFIFHKFGTYTSLVAKSPSRPSMYCTVMFCDRSLIYVCTFIIHQGHSAKVHSAFTANACSRGPATRKTTLPLLAMTSNLYNWEYFFLRKIPIY